MIPPITLPPERGGSPARRQRAPMTELRTLPEVAVLLRVSERTIRRLVAAGRLRPKYVGRRPVFTDREIEAYLAHANEPGRAA